MGLIYLFYLFIVKPKSKVQIPVKGLGVTLKSHGQPTHTPHPQLLAMKECSREKVFKGKKSPYDPPYPSRSSVGPGGQRDQEHGVVLHDQGEGYQPPKTSRSGSSQVPKGLRMTPPTNPS